MTVLNMEGVEHLHGNLYRVKNHLINFPEGKSEGCLNFFNSRHVLGTAKPKGFSKEEMNELREAIRTEGLENPLLLRPVEVDGISTLQLVTGERRKRCVDKLIKEDIECFDPSTESWKPASKFYEYIDCRINEMDDQTAFKHNFSENERSVDIGDGATIALINEWRKAGWTDEQILETTGKSVTWLKDTDALLNLDEVTFASLVNGEINRSAALQLAKVENIEERILILESAKSFAIGRIHSMKQKLKNEVEAAENKAEFADAVAVEAEIKGDKEHQQEAEKKAAKNRKRAEAKNKEAEELDDSAPKITSKDIHKAKNKIKEENSSDESDEGKTLTNAKISKYWYEPLTAIIQNEGLDENGDDLEISLEDANLVIKLLDARDSGERDIISILQDHKLSKEVEVEDDEDELEDDEDELEDEELQLDEEDEEYEEEVEDDEVEDDEVEDDEVEDDEVEDDEVEDDEVEDDDELEEIDDLSSFRDFAVEEDVEE